MNSGLQLTGRSPVGSVRSFNGHDAAGLSGILFVVLSLVIVVLVPPIPAIDTSAEQIAAYYSMYRMKFLIGNYLALLAAVPSFVFLAFLCFRIKQAEGPDGWMWMAVLMTLIFAHAVGTVDLVFFQMAAHTAGSLGPDTAKMLSDLANIGFGFFNITQFAFSFFMSLALLRTRVLKAWHGYLGYIVAAVSLLASLGSVVTTGFFSAGGALCGAALFIFMLWMLGMSLALLRRCTH